MSELDGIQEFSDKVDRLPGKIDSEANLEIGNILLSEMQENFRVGGRPSPWTPSGRVQAFGGRTLRQTGALLKSLIVSADDRGSEISSLHPGARIHALGGVIKPKKGDFLVFPVPVGLRTTSLKGDKPLKTPKKQYRLVFARQVTIKARDYRYISPRGFSFALSAAARHLITR